MTDVDETQEPRPLDFDAFWTEVEEGTIPVRFEGVVYQAPATPAASAVLRSIRLRDTKVEPADVFDLADGVLGQANREAILARNPAVSLEKLMAFVAWVSDRQAKAVTPPNRQGPATGKRRARSTSSRAGRSSRRTSSASTGSTSG